MISPDSLMSRDAVSDEQRTGVCPSCGARTHFMLIGVQRWSARVAAAAGLPQVVRLFVCTRCESTISEPHIAP